MKKVILIIVGIALLVGVYIIANRDQTTSQTDQTQTTVETSTAEKVYAQLPTWFSGATWSDPKATTEETYYGNI